MGGDAEPAWYLPAFSPMIPSVDLSLLLPTGRSVAQTVLSLNQKSLYRSRHSDPGHTYTTSE